MRADPPGTAAPEQRLADSFADEHRLDVPVPIEAIVAGYADLSGFRDDDSNADAVLHGLNEDLPRPVLLLNRDKPPRRRRFTLAHELGHILLPWHVGTIECETGADSDDDHDTGPAAYAAQEGEADRFASRIMVPRRYLDPRLDQPVPDLLTDLERANVSAEAGLWALANAMPPGHLFVIVHPGDTTGPWFASHGTLTRGIVKGQRLGRDALARGAARSGTVRHQDNDVAWFAYEAREELVEDTAEWRPVLLQIFADTRPGETPSGAAWKSFNAVASAVNSSTRTKDTAALAARINQRFRQDPKWADLADHPQFTTYAQRRARAFTGT